MDELPNELICMIFRYLDLNELFENCRLVSTKWLALVDSIKFKQLVITDLNAKYSNSWYHSLRPANLNNVMYFYTIFNWNLRSITIKNKNFSHLKFLKINFEEFIKSSNDYYNFTFDTQKLNEFIHLEELEIVGAKLVPKNPSICLPNLRILYLLQFNDVLVIDAAKLEVLYCPDVSYLKFVHPESIKFIENRRFQVDKLGSNLSEQFKMFSNLETYRIELFCSSPFDKQSLLSKLPNSLKELYFNATMLTIDQYTQWQDYFTFLLNDFKQGRSNIKLFFDGIDLKVNRATDTYGIETLELYLRNYDQLTATPWFKQIDYISLMNFLNNSIPSNFFSKFTNIEYVNVDRMVNQDLFVGFLKGCPNLIYLDIKNASFNQQFYDELSKITNALLNLRLTEDRTVQINFKFVSEFKILSSFYTNQCIPEPQAKYLIKNTKFLSSFKCLIKDQFVSISKIPRTNESYIKFQNYQRYRLELNDNSDNFCYYLE